jgi:hypothetical protein
MGTDTSTTAVATRTAEVKATRTAETTLAVTESLSTIIPVSLGLNTTQTKRSPNQIGALQITSKFFKTTLPPTLAVPTTSNSITSSTIILLKAAEGTSLVVASDS